MSGPHLNLAPPPTHPTTPRPHAAVIAAAALAATAAGQGVQGPWFNSMRGFVATRVVNVATNAECSATQTTCTVDQVIIDDYSDCVPSSGACAARNSVNLQSTAWNGIPGADRPCTLPSNLIAGRLSLSSNGQCVTMYCYK